MRISVCEFLRLQTNTDWFYSNPGHWISDGMAMQAFREADGVFRIIRSTGGQHRVLEYYEGKPSNLVRKRNRRNRP